MIHNLLDDLVKKRVDSTKPREQGLTHVTDKLHPTNMEDWGLISQFVDVVKINGALPLLAPDSGIAKKIKFYHDLDIRVSAGNTLSEYALIQNSFDRFAKEASKLGFDILEIGENIVDLNFEKKKKLCDIAESYDLEIQWKVGKQDPRHQLDVEDILVKIEEMLKLGSDKIVFEANQGVGVGIYDEHGNIKWSLVGEITNKCPPNKLIFEAPLESQQFGLIAEFGERVNLSEVDMESVSSIESERRGILSKSAFGNINLHEEPEGGPAAKFIYYLIKTKGPIEQSELISLSYLPRRTVQNAVEDLKNQGLVIERTSLNDARKKVYYPIRSEWL